MPKNKAAPEAKKQKTEGNEGTWFHNRNVSVIILKNLLGKGLSKYIYKTF